MGLTTVKLYNDYTGEKQNSEFNVRLDSLITNVSDLVEKKCGRSFGTATYKEWLNGDGTSILFLPQYPITRVKRVANGTNSAIKVENSGNDTATISSNSSAITLNSLSATGTETETYLYFTDYANVSSMTTAINNVSSWTATAQNIPTNETSLIQFMKPIYSEDALGSDVYISLASSNARFGIAYDSRNSLEMVGGAFPCGRRNVYVEWTAGYTLPVDNDQHSALTIEGDLPSGLVLVVNRIVQDVLNNVENDGNFKSEKLADYGYTRDDVKSVVDRYWSDLSEYAYILP